MDFKEYYVDNLLEARERATELRQESKKMSLEERHEIARKAAKVIEHYEKDRREKIEAEERERKCANYLYA